MFYWDRGIRSKQLDFRRSGEPSRGPVQSLVHQRIGDLSRTQKKRTLNPTFFQHNVGFCWFFFFFFLGGGGGVVAQKNVNRTESVLCWKNVGKMLGKKRTQNPRQTQQEDTFSEKATFSSELCGCLVSTSK